MTILIVDDEYYALESLRSKLEKHMPETDEIYCAYNAQQAMEIFGQHEVDLMITDVEMPGGTGLTLLEEVRSRGSDVICIFLSAYNKFEYISKAMKLSSVDYLLKPIDEKALYESVDAAVEKINQKKQAQINTLQAGYWKDSEVYLMEFFWKDLAEGSIRGDKGAIGSELRMRNLDEKIADTTFYLLLIQCIESNENVLEWNLFDFVLKNIVREFFYTEDEPPVVVRLSRRYYLLPLPSTGRSHQLVMDICRKGIKNFVPYLKSSFNFYVSAGECYPQQTEEVVGQMLKAAQRTINVENQIFDMASSFHTDVSVNSDPVPTEIWKDLLRRRKMEELQTEVLQYLTRLQHADHVYKEQLTYFYYAMIQLLSQHLEENAPDSISAFRAELMKVTADEACSSFQNLKNWVVQTIELADQCMSTAGSSDKAVRTVQEYVAAHLGEDISRDSLAAMVYLNPDYLSHIFKKELGLSLTNYIISERIKESKRLLATTDMSVRDIAINCGFQNLSYFSKQFKKATGTTPREYRG